MPEIELSPNAMILAERLGAFEEDFQPYAERVMVRWLDLLEKIIRVVPPQPARDRSKHFNTYVREVGSYPKSAFTAASGAPGGFKVKHVSKGQIRFTSQHMDRRYRKLVKAEEGAVIGELGNSATYSGWVIGPREGTPHQVAFHAETGWVSQDEAEEQARPEGERMMEEAANEYLAGLGG